VCTELGSGRQEVHTKYIAGKNIGNENRSITVRLGNAVFEVKVEGIYSETDCGFYMPL
jgi:hypothetical protein